MDDGFELAPPDGMCQVCSCPASSHHRTAPHRCMSDGCQCPGLVLYSAEGTPRPPCDYCGHAALAHGPVEGSCTEILANPAAKGAVCPCKGYKTGSNNPSAMRALYGHKVKVIQGEVPAVFNAVPRERNALRNALGRPPVQDEEIRKIVNEYIERTVEELGGMDSITAGQQAMLLSQRVAMEVYLMAEKELCSQEANPNALCDAGGEPLKILRTLQGFITVFRHGQVALGLARARRPKADQTITDVLAEYRTKKEGA